MNLQICVPYQKCPFNCPMCIARGRRVHEDLYQKDYDNYIEKLYNTIKENDVQDVVLTGDTDPSLNRMWLTHVSGEIKTTFPHIQTEMQTKNYNLKGYNLKNIDVLAYSITNSKEYLKAHSFRKIPRTNRLVILLTKDFNFLTADNFNAMGFDQITFKVLQYGADTIANKWTKENEMTDLSNIYKIIDRFNGSKISVRIDTNCQDSEYRYRVFRESGITYKDWE